MGPKIVPEELFLTLCYTSIFFLTANIDTRIYGHLTNSAKFATVRINTFTVYVAAGFAKMDLDNSTDLHNARGLRF